MSCLQKEIDLLKERIDKLEMDKVGANKPTIRQWQPKGGDWWINNVGKVLQIASDSRHMKFGTERPTEQQAERASIEMRRFNRLLALRDELCGDDEVVFDWTDDEIEKYYVYYWGGKAKPSWRVGVDRLMRIVTPCFTNMETAQKACNMLNSGEVEL